jgi:hypothetical protein
VEATHLDCRSANRTEGRQIDGSVSRGRGGDRRLPTPYVAAAGRLPVRVAGDHPAPDALVAAAPRISQLPAIEGDAPIRHKFKSYPIGYFHIGITKVRTERELYMLVAINRTSKFPSVELHEKATTRVPADFLRHLIAAVPYKVHTVLIDNGIHFTDPKYPSSAVEEVKLAIATGEIFRCHSFALTCAQNDIDHRLTKPRHPWTNGQVERMNRTIKEATVKRYHYDTHDELSKHLGDIVAAYNFGRRLKTLKGLIPYEAICKTWLTEPHRFTSDPTHQIPGPNI